MKKLSKFSKIAVLLLLLIGAIFAFTACDKVSAITIESANMPRLVFVQGQELDLSDGLLTVQSKDSSEEIALNASGVTVSGYDKNVLGAQELTIGYKGKTTTLSVTVVARVVAENIESDYFVGESFSKSVGRLKITRDDGSSFTVPMSDDSVTVEGFDSSAAARNFEVTARYRTSEVDYTGTFKVNIYDIESVSFTAPNKLIYKSHEEGIDLTGSYITMKGNGGALTRYVTVTEDMISGFDLSAATEDNMSSPLKQTVSIQYAGQHRDFTISITYSNVSLVRQIASEVASIDWTEIPDPEEITTSQGERALRGIELYMGLAKAEKALITEEEYLNVLRTATVYGYDEWVNDVESYADAFTIKDGTLSLLCKTYAATKAAYTALQDTTSPIYAVASLLLDVSENFGEVILAGEQTIGEYLIAVYDPENLEEVVGRFELMVSLYEALEDVPASWTEAGLIAYEEQIDAATALLAASPYTSFNDRAIYGMVSAWRDNDDLFEIIYTYYYNADDTDAIDSIKNLYLPGPLEELYVTIRYAMAEISAMAQKSRYDTTFFMLYYENALDLAVEILSASEGDDGYMYSVLYNYLTFDGLLTIGGEAASVPFGTLFKYLRTTQYGYLYQQNAALGDDSFEALWDIYLVAMNRLVYGTDYLKSEEYGEDMQALLKGFVEMSPSWQFSFLRSVNTYYYDYNVPAYALDVSNGAYTYFAYLLTNYYKGVLSEDAYTIFSDLLLALENYTRRYYNTTGIADFLSKMGAIEAAYGALTETEQETFDIYVGEFYQKYLSIYQRYENAASEDGEEETSDVESGEESGTEFSDLGEWAETFEELADAIQKFYSSYLLIQYQKPVYSMLFAAFEYAQTLENKILTTAPAEIVATYYYDDYKTIFKMDCSLEFSVHYLRGIYANYLTNLSVSSYMLYDLYVDAGIESFLAESAYVMWPYLDATINATDAEAYDAEKVFKIMSDFRALSAYQQRFFLMLDGNMDLYYGGLQTFFAQVLEGDEDTVAIADALLETEQAYLFYNLVPDGSYTVENEDGTTATVTYLEEFETAMEKAIALYEALTDEADKTAFNTYLSDLYAFYLAKYEALQTTEETESTESSTEAA